MMTAFSRALAALIAGAIACRPSAQSSADTSVAATSSTVPAITSGPSDGGPGPGSAPTRTAAATGGSKTTNRSAISGKSSVTSTQRHTDSVHDGGILGYDSVIRFPHRWVGKASSTPVRK
jgi:hypothetical protein